MAVQNEVKRLPGALLRCVRIKAPTSNHIRRRWKKYERRNPHRTDDATIAEDEREAEQAHVADREASADEARAAGRSREEFAANAQDVAENEKSMSRQGQGRGGDQVVAHRVHPVYPVNRCHLGIRCVLRCVAFVGHRSRLPMSDSSECFETITGMHHGNNRRARNRGLHASCLRPTSAQ
jgi:hypothetical protein